MRDGDKRIVSIQDGDPKGMHIIIVDDLVQVGYIIYIYISIYIYKC